MHWLSMLICTAGMMVGAVLVWFLASLYCVYRSLRQRDMELSTSNEGTEEAQKCANAQHIDDYQSEMNALLAQVNGRPEGIFGLAPRVSVEILRESCAAMVWTPLALMELAHPIIAYGLQQHSANCHHPAMSLRFIDTVRYGYAVMFAPTDEMLRISRFVYVTHHAAVGTIERDSGRHYKQGQTYSALEARALLWVFATMIEYGVMAHELLVRPLSANDKEHHYQFMRRIAPVWGLSPHSLPPSWHEFLNYYRWVINSGQLAVTPPLVSTVSSAFGHRPATLAHAMTLVPPSVRTVLASCIGTAPVLQVRWWQSCVQLTLIRMAYRLLPQRLRDLTAYSEWDCRRRGIKLGLLQRIGSQAGELLLRRIKDRLHRERIKNR